MKNLALLFLAKLQRSADKAAHEAGETSRAVGIASQQLRRIAELLDQGSHGPAQFVRIGKILASRVIILDEGRPAALDPGSRIRILSPTLESRHGLVEYLEVTHYESRDGHLTISPTISLACAGDWLEWHPLRRPR